MKPLIDRKVELESYLVAFGYRGAYWDEGGNFYRVVVVLRSVIAKATEIEILPVLNPDARNYFEKVAFEDLYENDLYIDLT